MSEWRLVETDPPPLKKNVLLALLVRYSNAPWKYTYLIGYRIDDDKYDDGSCNGLCDVYAWMPIPEGPPIPRTNERSAAMKRYKKETELRKKRKQIDKQMEELQ